MSNKNQEMNLERFATIVEAYGGAPLRWPEAERESALSFMKASQDAQRLAEEAEALDSLLDMPETAPVTRELQDKILAARLARADKPRVGPLTSAFTWRRWVPAAAVTCSLALGVAAGSQVPQMMGLDDETLALEAVTSALTASSSDADMFGGSE